MTYMSTITVDIEAWEIGLVDGLSIVPSSKPTRISADFNHQSPLSIRYQIVQNIPAVMKYRISVTRFQKKKKKLMNPLSHVSSSHQ